MKILIASDSFKETLSSKKVAKHIKIGFKKVFPEAKYICIPLADGGEGTVKALVAAKNGKIINVKVLNPLQKEINSFYGYIKKDKTAIIEMASASGLELLKEKEKNPMNTSTYGFGQLINHALKKGAKKLILGIGGSATNDAGIGMLQALGVKFLDADKKEINWGAKHISQIKHINTKKLNKKFKDIKIEVACDVKNTLCGPSGASFTFAKQKGADKKMIKTLDKYLFDFAIFCEKKNISKISNTKEIEGSGAAGGLGFALITFLNAQLKSGFDIVAKEVNLEKHIKEASLVITGEGKIDKQTIYGKTPIGVAKLAKKHNIKTIAIAGCLDKNYEIVLEHGIDAVFDITIKSANFKKLKKDTKKNLELCSYNIAKCLKMNIS
ncbi:MAG: glycerate kinase [Campylobacterales bacterium]|nr:glycerate kinase [Campylobacterales bacterium]